MEWIKAILAKHTKEDGTIDVEAANKEIDKEFPQNAVPKDQYNNVSNSLKEANSTIKTLEDKVKDNPDVQKELETYKSKAEKLESENKQLVINHQVSTALRDAGAKDVEYATFKLGQLELNKDGNVKDLANKVKDLQSALPDYFAQKDDGKDKADPMNKFKPISPNLSKGDQTKSFTMAEIEKMTPEEINQNWDAVSVTLTQGGNE
ncbi:phage scaffolding protein [Enterococcus italicus]|uniref:phage scaffolding protein n=1 Tax=Enterococcus italicus TaxID=246144 RepID=UPI0028A838E0|nr:phage scaffolding protein [Enterococcus italicus]